jgi:uncharacterized repeat protein (TIGR04076 family)
MKFHTVLAEVKAVEGECLAGYKKGDRIFFTWSSIDTEKSRVLCPWALHSILSVSSMFFLETTPTMKEMGIGNTDGMPVNCPDPGPSHGGHGRVVFEVRKAKEKFVEH